MAPPHVVPCRLRQLRGLPWSSRLRRACLHRNRRHAGAIGAKAWHVDYRSRWRTPQLMPFWCVRSVQQYCGRDLESVCSWAQSANFSTERLGMLTSVSSFFIRHLLSWVVRVSRFIARHVTEAFLT